MAEPTGFDAVGYMNTQNALRSGGGGTSSTSGGASQHLVAAVQQLQGASLVDDVIGTVFRPLDTRKTGDLLTALSTKGVVSGLFVEEGQQQTKIFGILSDTGQHGFLASILKHVVRDIPQNMMEGVDSSFHLNNGDLVGPPPGFGTRGGIEIG